MDAESQKKERELRVFCDFLEKSRMSIDPKSIRNGDPNIQEPDIICRHEQTGPLAFELVEICDQSVAALVNQPTSNSPTAVRVGDPTEQTLRQKFVKTYKAEGSIDLLCYTADRIILPDNVLIPKLQRILKNIGTRGCFKRIWFLGEDGVQQIGEAS